MIAPTTSASKPSPPASWPRRRWVSTKRLDDGLLRDLSVDVPPLIAQLCANRGLTERSDLDAYFSTPRIESVDPYRLPDMGKAVDRIERAVRDAEKIAVYGDYDVDGVCGTALLVQFLTAIGARVQPFLPSRQRDGYGLRREPLERLRAAGVSLVVTVDCGISGVPEVAYAAGIGLDVVVTDHHAVSSELPVAVAVVNPRRHDGGEADRCLAGVGIAFRLAQALAVRFPAAEALLPTLLDLVALATVADVCALTGQNRDLVRLGLGVINRRPRPGIQALIQRSGVVPGKLDAEAIAFRLGPRINAAGRMADADAAYRLLTAVTVADAEPFADRLDALNQQRQVAQERSLREARAMVGAMPALPTFLVVASSDWGSGTVGLVAGKLTDAYCRPALVLSQEGDVCRGSARGIPGFDVTAALASCESLLIAFGGHKAAAGCSLSADHVEELTRRLDAYADSRLTQDDFVPTLEVDALVRCSTLGEPAVRQYFKQMEPFGEGNPEPFLRTNGVEVVSPRLVGKTGEHLKFTARTDAGPIASIAFRMGSLLPALPRGTRVDLVYTARWRTSGYHEGEALELCVEDLLICPRRSTPPGA